MHSLNHLSFTWHSNCRRPHVCTEFLYDAYTLCIQCHTCYIFSIQKLNWHRLCHFIKSQEWRHKIIPLRFKLKNVFWLLHSARSPPKEFLLDFECQPSSGSWTVTLFHLDLIGLSPASLLSHTVIAGTLEKINYVMGSQLSRISFLLLLSQNKEIRC